MRNFTNCGCWLLAALTTVGLILVPQVAAQESSGNAIAASVSPANANAFSAKTVTKKCTLTFEPPPNQGNQSCKVSCPKGTVLLSGGGLPTGGSIEILMSSSSPTQNQDSGGWWVQWYPAYALTQQEQVPVQAYAVCATVK